MRIYLHRFGSFIQSSFGIKITCVCIIVHIFRSIKLLGMVLSLFCLEAHVPFIRGLETQYTRNTILPLQKHL